MTYSTAARQIDGGALKLVGCSGLLPVKSMRARRASRLIRMYGFWRSSAAFRVRIALNLKGLAYTEQMVDLDACEQHAPEYLAINPAGSVPTVFVDNGPPLTQSLAILEYLAG